MGEASMKQRGFFLLALVLCVTTPALAQSTRDLEADRLADKLWRILDITKQYQPQFQAYVTLEAPDGERVALTFQVESARTLVHDDVITLARKSDIPADLSEHAMGGYFTSVRRTAGLRVWLYRPWGLTGTDERLGVLVYRDQAS